MKKLVSLSFIFMSAISLADVEKVPDIASADSASLEQQHTLVAPPPTPVSAPVPAPAMVHINFDSKERTAVALARQWKSHPENPRRGEDGSVVYLFGATLPTMICSPLRVCAIRLQAGEIVNDVHVGDAVHWNIFPATSGSNDNPTTLITIKPFSEGQTTNLLVTTNRRVYSIKLVSAHRDWIPLLAFDYPADVNAVWADYRQQHRQYIQSTTLDTGQNIAGLDFNYNISGDHPSWYPLRVYTDGIKTYIQFPTSRFYGSEAPSLVALGKSNMFGKSPEDLVNYRLVGDRYVVDKVLDKAALVSGTGSNQIKVIITRKGGR